MKGFKHYSIAIMLLVGMLVFSSIASAGVFKEAKVDSFKVEIENEKICPLSPQSYDEGCGSPGVNAFDFERGQQITIDVKVSANDFLDTVEIQGSIFGYEFNNIEPISDTTKVFDMDPNTTYFKKLKLYLPTEAEEDNYKLRLIISDRYGDSLVKDYNLKIDSPRHGFQIEDVVFSPGPVVQAGRALLATVRVENKGENTEESVKVTVAVPELGISASDFIDEVEFQDSETSEELYLRIPTCAQPGDYSAIIEVRYNQLRESVTEEAIITITPDETCPAYGGSMDSSNAAPKTVISVGASAQNLQAGQAGAIYPLTIVNEGGSAKTYTVSVEGTNDFASVQINPVSTFVLSKGEAQAVYLYLTPIEGASAGQRVFTATVSSGDKVLKQVPLTANVVASSNNNASATTDWTKLKRALEIGLIILVVILVIIGLIIGFNKLKGDDEDFESEGKDEGQTYY